MNRLENIPKIQEIREERKCLLNVDALLWHFEKSTGCNPNIFIQRYQKKFPTILAYGFYKKLIEDPKEWTQEQKENSVIDILCAHFKKDHDGSLLISCIYRVRHIKSYRAIALKLLIISKNVSDKSFSVREGRHTRPRYFFIGGGAGSMSRSTPLFFMTLLPTLRRIQRPTRQGHSNHAKYENSRKIETYQNNHFQRIH